MNNLLQKRIFLKNKLLNRDKTFGGWVSYSHPSITETFALAGFDFIAIDMEHSTISTSEAQKIITASQGLGVPCLPRPVSHSNDWFKPLLDSGADGLVVQMVNNASELKLILDCMKYPPIGNRSFGLNRAQFYGFNFDEYVKKWNDSSSLIIQIESIEAVKNIEELLSFDDVDGVMIGPYDMSGSLGVPGKTNHPKVVEASKRVIEACKKYKKSCGTQLSVVTENNINDAFDLGYTFVILSSDLFILWQWSENIRHLIKKLK